MKLLKIIKLMASDSKYRNRYIYLTPYALGSRHLPKLFSNIIRKSNEKRICKEKLPYLQLKTYDGSGQVVHPDLIKWNGRIWAVLTPYPYEVDTYENPCVYSGDSVFSLKPVHDKPLAFPTITARKNHISDPCIYAEDGILCVLYRDTLFDGDTEQFLFQRTSDDGITWTDPVIIANSKEESYVSPAVIYINENKYLFYVKLTTESGGNLIRASMKGNTVEDNARICQCMNMPENYALWHVGIVSRDSYNKVSDNEMLGVFVLRNVHDLQDYILYWAESDDGGINWSIKEKTAIPQSISEKMSHVYKSAIIPDTGDVLLSLRDNEFRWYFAVIPGDRDRAVRNTKVSLLDSYRIFSRVFSNGMSKERFEYKHQGNPYLVDPYYYLYVEDGKVLGTNCFIGTAMRIGGVSRNVVQSCDTAVIPEARGKGIFTKVINEATDIYRDLGIDAMIGFPNNNSYHGFVKMGWEHIDTLPTLIRLSHPFEILLSKAGFRIGRSIHLDANKIILQGKPIDVLLESQCPFNSEDLGLINSKHANMIVRTTEYYKWKIDNNSEYYYLIYRKSSMLLAYFIFIVNFKGRLTVADWFVNSSDGDDIYMLLKAACEQLSKFGNTLVIPMVNTRLPEYSAFRKLHFFDGQNKPFGFHPARLIVKTLNKDISEQIKNLEDWFVTYMDVDLSIN